MKNSWKNLEELVKDMASIIWNRPANPERIEGVNFDAVVHISDEEIILIEVTKEFNLEKVRTDISKIHGVKLNFAIKSIFAKAYILLEREPTPGMLELGKASKINVQSIEQFTREIFDFKTYKNLRENVEFGSAINPTTGKSDHHKYIPVMYTNENQTKVFSVDDICKKLLKKEKLILLGEYGTGKSRCTKEVFSSLSSDSIKNLEFVFAINLREHWGAFTADEIIAGHLKRLGMSGSIDKAMQLLVNGHIILILDGFDEVGSQTFGVNQDRRASIRKEALQGIRELISLCSAGVLITGRPHYFNGNK